MLRCLRFFWLVTLLIFLSGCSSYRMVGLPAAGQLAGDQLVDDQAPIPTATPHSKVKVTLVSGKVVTGEVLRVSPEEIVLRDPNYGYAELVISSSDIVVIEEEYKSEEDRENNKFAVWAAIAALPVVMYIGLLNSNMGN